MLCIGFVSCGDWLNVNPEDEISEDELFSTGEGYRNALNGVYKQFSSAALYGYHLSWGLIDGMGQYYDRSNNWNDIQGITRAAIYEFDHYDTKPLLENLWNTAYNAVANCNNIIKHIENAPASMFAEGEEERDLIYGEALGLRAVLQFDLLRLYAPSPVMGGRDKKVLPYKEEYPSRVSPKLTVQECIDDVIRDLKKAHELIAGYDNEDRLSGKFSINERFKEYGGTSRFLSGRGFRLNTYAARAVLARVYLYNDQVNEALAIANELIALRSTFRFPSSAYSVTSTDNMKLIDDVIGGWYVKKLTDWDRDALSKGTSYDSFLQLLDPKKYFPTSNDTDRDWRFTVGIEYYGSYSEPRSLKNRNMNSLQYAGKTSQTLIPLIRMSEVYYIAAECEIRKATPDFAAATAHLVTVKKGRGISNAETVMGTLSTEDAFYNALLEDARREFIGEGQIFFMHKRLGVSLTGSSNISYPINEVIIPSLPDSETVI